MENVIYYFTGTGNSLRAAKVVGKRIGNVDLISMRTSPNENSAINAETIGFIFPVYHWTLPEMVEHFILMLDINPNAYIYAISTPSFINGNVFQVIETILNMKGCKLSYCKILYSVANLVISYSPKPSPKIRVPQTEKHLRKIASEVYHKKKTRIIKSSLLVSLLYPRIMPKYKELLKIADNGFIIKDSCLSCGVCAKVCSSRNIELINGRPHFLHKCSLCMACIAFCPSNAFLYRLEQFDEINLSDKQKKILKDPLVRGMKLPENREKYHNPYISIKDMSMDKQHV